MEVFIDLPENGELFEEYKHDIPVLHLNGKFLMKHKVNIKVLERRLDAENIIGDK